MLFEVQELESDASSVHVCREDGSTEVPLRIKLVFEKHPFCFLLLVVILIKII